MLRLCRWPLLTVLGTVEGLEIRGNHFMLPASSRMCVCVCVLVLLQLLFTGGKFFFLVFLLLFSVSVSTLLSFVIIAVSV